MGNRIVAVDFDGTCVDHRYPDVGCDVPGAARTLMALSGNGVRLILWTMRSGKELEDARLWFADRGIPLFGVNENPDQKSWTDSPKAYAHAYVDDAALGCPLVKNTPTGGRPWVDWEKVADLLRV